MNEVETLLVQWAPLVWLVVAIIMVVVEAASIQLMAVWFALGAVVAMVPALMGASLWTQFWVFLIVSILALVGTRPFVKKVLKMKQVRTNADSMVGRVGVVVEEIPDAGALGRVDLAGQLWSAISDDGGPIPVGEKVLIKSIEGVKVVVERIL